MVKRKQSERFDAREFADSVYVGTDFGVRFLLFFVLWVAFAEGSLFVMTLLTYWLLYGFYKEFREYRIVQRIREGFRG